MSNKMNWLTMLGQNIAKGLSFVMPFAQAAVPIVAATNPEVGGIMAAVVNIVAMVEQMSVALGAVQGGGDAKLKAALPLVITAVEGSALVAGKPIVDRTLFEKSCADLTSAVVGIMNSVAPPALAAPAPPTPAIP